MPSDAVIISILALIGTIITCAITSYTSIKLNKVATTVNTVHLLVNSRLGALLKTTAITLRRLAYYSKLPDDIAAAHTAETAVAEHEENQAIVDSKNHA